MWDGFLRALLALFRESAGLKGAVRIRVPALVTPCE